ncbi:MAG TPA: DNA recombination protein RmuC [Candidatus Pullichristensenella avicola]|nr:DNA recombination protein RmuC [Candidatus Pullichristensenella avicola]
MLERINQNPGLTAVVCAIAAILALWAIAALLRRREARAREEMERRILQEQAEMLERLRQATFESVRGAREGQEQSLLVLGQAVSASAQQVAELSRAMEDRQDRLRRTLDERLDVIARLNDRKLEQMRQTVSEKLESTLENRLGESFKLVNEQLSRVHKGLGEMQTLAQGVGDLKKVLTNVKTRGVWGEVRLRALLEDGLAAGQFIENAQVTPGSAERVEFAIRLPASDGEGALLPVDSKFPQEDYLRLVNASQAGDGEGVRAATQQLVRAVTEQARRVSDKYIKPPVTTDYAVLFLPVESLYAEVARVDGLLENLQNKFRVLVAGPSTFAALLTSLQMGFRTVALQKRSGEVLALLSAVRAEFQKYGEAVQKARTRLEQASGDLDAIDTRTRVINRKLRDIGEDVPPPDGKDAGKPAP